MAKLFSHHDKFHVHAVLGLLALLHFLGRFSGLFVTGRCSFAADAFSTLTLGVHVLLHATSFQFELPRNRQWSQPMIWREFRVHNAIFAYRHLIAAALGIWAPVWWYQAPYTMSTLVAKMVLVAVTCYTADMATARIGDTEKRTTNAMPYPPEMVPYEPLLKWFYAKSQFAATSLALFGTPSLSFLSVLAIEIASFLMTLVRKGLIAARTYHLVYAASLFIMFPCMVVTLHGSDELASMASFRGMVACFFGCELRMNRRWNKYIAWAPAVAVAAVADQLQTVVNVKYIAWIGMIWSMVDTLQVFMQARRSAANGCGSPKVEEEAKAKVEGSSDDVTAGIVKQEEQARAVPTSRGGS